MFLAGWLDETLFTYSMTVNEREGIGSAPVSTQMLVHYNMSCSTF